MVLMEEVVACFKISPNFSGKIEENHEELHSG
jgi:hypothetical protein